MKPALFNWAISFLVVSLILLIAWEFSSYLYNKEEDWKKNE